MNWYHEWQALCARIQGLLDAGAFFYGALEHSSADDLSVRKRILLVNAQAIYSALNAYLQSYREAFPERALETLERFLNRKEVQEFNFDPGLNQIRGHVQFALTSLAAFKSEFSYIIADTQATALRITERAFLHLQRSIIVDDDIRTKWIAAFGVGETKCEQAGALHLLAHGIWAFKAHGEKGRTDLILNEPLPDSSIIEKTSTALVLTEWKTVKDKSDIDEKIRDAYEQAKLYLTGVLGGIELTNYRYLVMVTEKGMKMPSDLLKGTIVYRHINIAVNPDTPSVEAKKLGPL